MMAVPTRFETALGRSRGRTAHGGPRLRADSSANVAFPVSSSFPAAFGPRVKRMSYVPLGQIVGKSADYAPVGIASRSVRPMS